MDKGASFHYNTTVLNVEKAKNSIKKIYTDKGDFQADKYVLACAAFSPLIARMVGEYLPIYPVKGYSMTLPI